MSVMQGSGWCLGQQKQRRRVSLSSQSMKSQQRILELHSLLSKLLDSLCFEVAINKNDDNCLSLLEILLWRRKGDINQDEFVELYKSWLESKSIFDLFSARQVEAFPKHELIVSELAQAHFMNIGQINKALESLNEMYNRIYLQLKPANEELLRQAQRIFSYLDPQGLIHLRLSSLFFLAGAAMVCEKYSIPLNYESYRVYFEDTRKELCEIEGIVSLRGFKNYLLSLGPGKRANLLEHLLPVLGQVERHGAGQGSGVPNLIEEAFEKWGKFPRFGSAEKRKNWEVYKRVFEENERVFYDEGATVEYFSSKYGEEFVDCFSIDSSLLREFNILLKDCLNRYIEVFIKVSHSYGPKNPHPSHKKKQLSELQPRLSHRPSAKEKTPTKTTTKKIDLRNRTPTKRVERPYQNEVDIKREFGSADKSKSKTFHGRQTTPTKSHRGLGGLFQSQVNPGSQKMGVKKGIDKDSFYNKMFFFRNKRVESYDVVMKRLRAK